MNILIVPDKYKGSLNALQVAQCIAKGIQNVLPKSQEHAVELLPFADGGDGTVDVCARVLNGSLQEIPVLDAYGHQKKAQYFLQNPPKNASSGTSSGASSGASFSDRMALIESAKIIGIAGHDPHILQPQHANSRGLGMCIAHAIKQHPKEIIVGLGGSATVDGGIGMLEFLGFSFEYAHHTHKNPLLNRPLSICRPSHWDTRINITVASDVRNPLLGKEGAVYCFGAQKGIAHHDLQNYENAMYEYARMISNSKVTNALPAHENDAMHTRFDTLVSTPGTGAAGGLGFAFSVLMGARIAGGFDILSDYTDLETKIARADLVITGEGKLDLQSMYGKVPAGILNLVKKHNKKLLLIVGKYSEDALRVWKSHKEVCGVFASSPDDESWDIIVSHAATRLVSTSSLAMRTILSSSTI